MPSTIDSIDAKQSETRVAKSHVAREKIARATIARAIFSAYVRFHVRHAISAEKFSKSGIKPGNSLVFSRISHGTRKDDVILADSVTWGRCAHSRIISNNK
jgi:hypothetical protein